MVNWEAPEHASMHMQTCACKRKRRHPPVCRARSKEAAAEKRSSEVRPLFVAVMLRVGGEGGAVFVG